MRYCTLVDDCLITTLIKFGVFHDLLLVLLEIESRLHTDGITRGVGIALEMVEAGDRLGDTILILELDVADRLELRQASICTEVDTILPVLELKAFEGVGVGVVAALGVREAGAKMHTVRHVERSAAAEFEQRVTSCSVEV